MGLTAGALLATLLLVAAPAAAQLSTWSVQTFGEASSSKDSVRVPLAAPTQPADVGAGAFTIEQWLRCARADNVPLDTTYYAPDSTPDTGSGLPFWIWGRIFLDRDINAPGWTGGGKWGASIHRATNASGNSVVRWGATTPTAQLGVQGSTDICDDTWHHVAVGRDGTNHLFIIVDGVEDYRSTGANTISGNLALPSGATDPADPYLVWGNEKHGFQGGLVGYLDELRAWSTERSIAQISANRFVTLAAGTASLELYLRLEEGSGQTLADTTGKNAGTLFYAGAWTMVVPSGGGATSTSTTSTTSISSSTSPGGSTSSTTAPGPGSSSTSTSIPRACAGVADCDDLDPCTSEDCVAGACRQEPASGVGGATCELRRFVGVPLCLAHPPRARIERPIERRIAVAARLLDAAAAAGLERPRGRRKTKAALAKLGSAERRIRKATEKRRLADECGAIILIGIERARAALVPGDAARAGS